MVITKAAHVKKDSDDDTHIRFKSEKDIELSSTLAEIHEKQKEAVVRQDAEKRGIPYINLKSFPVSQDALLLLDHAFCNKEKVVCFYYKEGQIRFGALDTSSPRVIAKAKEF